MKAEFFKGVKMPKNIRYYFLFFQINTIHHSPLNNMAFHSESGFSPVTYYILRNGTLVV